ncbi:Phage integrase family protein [Micromonospora rhizosphaerae]|uniref:Phage integrase family protein n=1 Tax=Micromonospora rhizosphaerae TaxID=568872 RepID=A0A1C6SDH7_9ACTN|nr:Phage integrase family protein [Micromonospora rhizosphaerae]
MVVQVTEVGQRDGQHRPAVDHQVEAPLVALRVLQEDVGQHKDPTGRHGVPVGADGAGPGGDRQPPAGRLPTVGDGRHARTDGGGRRRAGPGRDRVDRLLGLVVRLLGSGVGGAGLPGHRGDLPLGSLLGQGLHGGRSSAYQSPTPISASTSKTEESDASLPLPAICVTALRHRYRQQEAAREKARDAWHDTGMAFTTRYGLPVEPRNFNRSYDSRIANAGAPKITVHDARRTCASLLVDLDVHPRIAMAILRHADFSITMEIYSQVSSKATREALREPRPMSRCCTSLLYKIRNGHPEDPEWPLTCVGTAGFEPTTP